MKSPMNKRKALISTRLIENNFTYIYDNVPIRTNRPCINNQLWI